MAAGEVVEETWEVSAIFVINLILKLQVVTVAVVIWAVDMEEEEMEATVFTSFYYCFNP